MVEFLNTVFIAGLVAFVGCGVGLRLASDTRAIPGGAPPGGPISVAQVTPTTGSRGTKIKVLGDGFGSDATVSVGGAACGQLAVVSSVEITCEVGLHARGQADVVVRNANFSTSLAKAFNYRNFLVVLTAIGKLTSFEIGEEGGLTLVNEVSTTGSGHTHVMDPRGRFVFVAAPGAQKIVVHPFDPERGELSALTLSSVASSTLADLVVDPMGTAIFYVHAGGVGDMFRRSFDRASVIFGAPIAAGLAADLISLTLFENATQRFLYGVTSTSPGRVHAVTNQSGSESFSAVPGSPFAANASSSAIRLSNDGRFALVVDDNTGVRLSSLRRDGSSGALVLEDNISAAADFDRRAIAIHPTLDLIYIGDDATGSIARLGWNANGTLTDFQDFGAEPSTDVKGVVIDPGARWLYSSNTRADIIRRLNLDAEGTISSSGSLGTAVPDQPATLTIN